MNVNMPKTLNKLVQIEPDDMEVGKVYQFSHLLAAVMTTGCIITVDTNDNDVMTFNDYSDFESYLDDNSLGTKGEVTPYQMSLSVK